MIPLLPVRSSVTQGTSATRPQLPSDSNSATCLAALLTTVQVRGAQTGGQPQPGDGRMSRRSYPVRGMVLDQSLLEI